MNTISLNNKATWIDIEKPSPSDVEQLRRDFNFHDTVLNELIPNTIRTKVDDYGDYFYIVLHFPIFDKKTRSTKSQELDILVTKDHVITSHKEPIIALKSLFDKCNLYPKEKDNYLSGGAAKLLYFIIENILNNCLNHLDDMSEFIDKAEGAIFHGKEKSMIQEISIIKRNILDFRRALKPQKQLLESLYVTTGKFFGDEYLPFYNKLVGYHLRIWDILDNYKELTESLETTNATLFSSKMNETIRILTVFTALLLPASIIVGIFGTNVIIPLQHHPLGFWMVAGLAIIAPLIIYAYFKNKKVL